VEALLPSEWEDKLIMLENAYFSVISPEGCAAILWKDGSRAQEAADMLKLTAPDLKAEGLVDEVLPEPQGAAHKDSVAMAGGYPRGYYQRYGRVVRYSSAQAY